jgi:hypothetical protein
MGAEAMSDPDAARPEPSPSPEVADTPAPQPETGAGPAPQIGAEAPADPAADLPPVETIGPETDLSPWLKPGVPAALKNAAMRRKWLSLPAIRDYVDPALDYAWDWNTAKPVPGAAGRIAQAAADKMIEALTTPHPAVTPRPEPAPAAPEGQQAAATRTAGTQPSLESGAAAPDALKSDGPAQAAPAGAPTPPTATPAEAAPARRRHGGAAPLLPETPRGGSA